MKTDLHYMGLIFNIHLFGTQLKAIGDLLTNGGYEYIEANKFETYCLDVVQSIKVYQRYTELKRLMPDMEIKYDTSQTSRKVEAFVLMGHEFHTLDEVENAIKNKAFL